MLFSSSKREDPQLDPLRKYLQVMTAVGTGGFFFAKTCGRQFMKVVYTDKWATDSCETLLQAYCLYCIFMALNGISEAYAFSKGIESTLQRLRWVMMLNSIGYIAMSYFLSQRIGIVGLVYANCANMLLRATSCVYFTFRQFEKSGSEAVYFFVSIFTGKIFLGLVSLALAGCFVLQRWIFPLLFK